jgi:hypothetical protein
MDRRRNARISVQLPVNVWGLDAFGQAFTSPAIVTNMSTDGLVLYGVRRRMRIGDSLDVRMGTAKAQFRVIWIGETSELGLETVAGQAFFPPSVLVHCSRAAATC